MITREEFSIIDTEVKDSIYLTLNSLRVNSQDNYILFLADGEYKQEYDNGKIPFSPFIIDNRVDRYKDETRLKFLSDFLSAFYSFPMTQISTDDNEQRLHMELMIYTHIWESKPFLKKLYRLSHLDNKEEYNWNIIVPDMGKHDFIRNDIRKTFEANKNPLADVLKKSFHTSLRNAFAHSEYSFDTMNEYKLIRLDNYNGEIWELQEISFDDWSKRFVYSAFLSYYMLRITHENRIAVISDLGTDTFTIKHPSSRGVTRNVNIIYRQEFDDFHFED